MVSDMLPDIPFPNENKRPVIAGPSSGRIRRSREQEQILADYISQADDISFELTSREASMKAENRVE